jgi:hypothetical protein
MISAIYDIGDAKGKSRAAVKIITGPGTPGSKAGIR